MNELSLFSGAGGGLLGTKLLGWRHIGYVEWDDYCQKIIAQRIKDGILDEAPIFGDLRTFNTEYARKYRGVADIVTGGFPCQPFSIAGKRAGADDERNMWPATIECIRLVRPRYALLENVSGLLVSGYFGRILGDLAESGYDCRWRILSAAEVGAPHRRDRLWIVAYPSSVRCDTGRPEQPLQGSRTPGKAPVADADGAGQSARSEPQPQGEGIGIERFQFRGEGNENNRWWASEPELGRVAHGVADRVDRLKALGNGQVPLCVATAFHLLTQDVD